jgi:WD40 repeat protein
MRPDRPQQVLEGHSGRVHAVAWVESGQAVGVGELAGVDESVGADESTGMVVTAGEDCSVRVWDLSMRTAARTAEGPAGGGEHLVVLPAPQGDVVVSCGQGTVLDVRDLRTGEGPRRLRGHTRAVSALAGAMIDGDPYVASGSGPGEGTVRVWNLARGWTRWELSTYGSRVQTVSLRQIGDRLLVAAGVAHQLFVWEPEVDERPNTVDGHVSLVRSVEIGEIAGRLVVISGGDDRFCRIWDLDTGESSQLKCAAPSVDLVALTTLDSTPVVVTASGKGGAVEVWDAESGRRLQALEGAIDGVTAMALGTDGRRPLAVCGGSNGVAEVWDLAEGTCLSTLGERSEKVSAVQLGRFDGRTIAAVGSTEGWAEVWDLAEPVAPRRCASIYGGKVSALALRERVLVIGTPLGVTTVELR